MNDAADLGNAKASAIEEASIQNSLGVKNNYVIGYCSADGDLVVENKNLTSKERLAYMSEELGIDPLISDNWAFCQWSNRWGRWDTILAGNGEMEQKLRDHMKAHPTRPR